MFKKQPFRAGDIFFHHVPLSRDTRYLARVSRPHHQRDRLAVRLSTHPRLRARHLPFIIGKSERDQWMLCMVQTFDDLKIAEPIRSELLHSLLNLADHMRNKPEA